MSFNLPSPRTPVFLLVICASIKSVCLTALQCTVPMTNAQYSVKIQESQCRHKKEDGMKCPGTTKVNACHKLEAAETPVSVPTVTKTLHHHGLKG